MSLKQELIRTINYKVISIDDLCELFVVKEIGYEGPITEIFYYKELYESDDICKLVAGSYIQQTDYWEWSEDGQKSRCTKIEVVTKT